MVKTEVNGKCHIHVKFSSRSHQECSRTLIRSQKRSTAQEAISYERECVVTSTISAGIKSLLIAGLLLCSSQPAICQSTTDETKIRYIEGLVEVQKKPKRFVYKCKNTTETVTLTEKVKDVPDLRPYEVAHPIKHKSKQALQWTHDKCEFWGPIVSFAGWLATVALEAAKRCG